MTIFPDLGLLALVIEPSTTVRGALTQCLKASGFANVQGLPSLKDMINVLEVERVGWIIAPAGGGEDIELLGILNLCKSQAHLRAVRISMITTKETERYLPYA